MRRPFYMQIVRNLPIMQCLKDIIKSVFALLLHQRPKTLKLCTGPYIKIALICQQMIQAIFWGSLRKIWWLLLLDFVNRWWQFIPTVLRKMNFFPRMQGDKITKLFLEFRRIYLCSLCDISEFCGNYINSHIIFVLF